MMSTAGLRDVHAVVHDLNNHFATIQGFTELASEMASPGSALTECLDEIRVAAQNAVSVIQELRTVAPAADRR